MISIDNRQIIKIQQDIVKDYVNDKLGVTNKALVMTSMDDNYIDLVVNNGAAAVRIPRSKWCISKDMVRCSDFTFDKLKAGTKYSEVPARLESALVFDGKVEANKLVFNDGSNKICLDKKILNIFGDGVGIYIGESDKEYGTIALVKRMDVEVGIILGLKIKDNQR